MHQTSERLTYTVKEAAGLLGLSKNTAYSLARKGQLPGAMRLGEKRIVVSKYKLDKFLTGNNPGNGVTG